MIKLSKKAVILTLALIAVIATAGTAFAYWSSGFGGKTDTKTATIQIGSGGTVATTLTLSDMTDDRTLVPTRHVGEDEDYTDTAEYACNVQWASSDSDSTLSAAGVTGTLTVTLTGIKIGGTDYTDDTAGFFTLFAFSVKSGESEPSANFNITDQAALALTLMVKMNEPSKAQYDIIQGQSVTFTFTFTVAVNS